MKGWVTIWRPWPHAVLPAIADDDSSKDCSEHNVDDSSASVNLAAALIILCISCALAVSNKRKLWNNVSIPSRAWFDCDKPVSSYTTSRYDSPSKALPPQALSQQPARTWQCQLSSKIRLLQSRDVDCPCGPRCGRPSCPVRWPQRIAWFCRMRRLLAPCVAGQTGELFPSRSFQCIWSKLTSG